MNEVLADQVELNSLVMLNNKQGWLQRTNDQLKDSISRIANYSGPNGVATATVPTTTVAGETDAIVNRSPRTDTTNNNYPVKSDAPWVALIILLLILCLAAMLMWWSAQPKAVTPDQPVKPPVTTGSVSKADPNYIEFYRP